MTGLFFLFATLLLVILFIRYFVVLLTAKTNIKKIENLAIFVLFSIFFIVGLTTLQGQPKSAALSFVSKTQVEVLAAHMVKNKAIYIWVLEKDKDYPISIQLPWNEQLAEALYQALQHAASTNGKVVTDDLSQLFDSPKSGFAPEDWPMRVVPRFPQQLKPLPEILPPHGNIGGSVILPQEIGPLPQQL